MLLACHHISKSFGTDVIIKDATFIIEEKQKAAVVGINGAGKTTLLEIINGSLHADSGEVVLAKDRSIGYLAQHQEMEGAGTVYEEVFGANRELLAMESRLRSLEEDMKLAAGNELERLMDTYTTLTHSFELINGYAYRSEVTGVLKGLGFSEDDFGKKCSELSGGLKTRVALARLLLLKPDLIMLDEPTNHLDMASVKWLEDYLCTYPGAVLVVAHDRFFLDRIAERIIEIDGGSVSVFEGNYTDYSIKKEALRLAALSAYENQQSFIKHQEEVIRRLHSFNREKSVKRARSREKMLARLDVLDRPSEVKSDMLLTFSTGGVRSGDEVLTIRGLSKSYGPLKLFDPVDIDIRRGERVAVIGENGTGKTTLLKIINGLVPADTGSVRTGANVTIGYYDQEQQLLSDEKTVFGEIRDAYPAMTDTAIRNTLALFLFTGDDVFKQVSALSGGERGRLSLAKLILSPCNLLILDEPTNHLDIVSKEVLENALETYEGTLLFVSHDRYFINRIADRILELEDKTFNDYRGDYEYYLEQKGRKVAAADAPGSARAETGASPAKGTPPVQVSASKEDWQRKKDLEAARRKRLSDMKKAEDEISRIEERIAEIDELLTKEEIYTDNTRCMELTGEQNSLRKRSDELFELWSSLEEAEAETL